VIASDRHYLKLKVQIDNVN